MLFARRSIPSETTGLDLAQQHTAIVAAHNATLDSLRDDAEARRDVIDARVQKLEAEAFELDALLRVL